MNSTLLDNYLAQTTPFPVGLKVSHAKDSYIFTTDGKKYLDMISGLAVSHLGHGLDVVKEAIISQLNVHSHVMVYGEFQQSSQSALAETLNKIISEISPEAGSKLNTTYLVNSGTEANEAAIKLVRRSTGRSKIIAFKGAYHGASTGSLAISYNEQKKYAFRPLMPDVEFIELNSTLDLELIDSSVAGVFLETIQGDAGIRIPDADYMFALRKKCNEHGVLLVLDEIQAGLGRTGKMFAFQHYNILPDVLILGKALGGGMPIGAMVSSRHLMETFTVDPMLGHITTFGGHPVVAAAANAALNELIRLDVISAVHDKGLKITHALKDLKAVKEVRQIGLFIAVELETPEQVQKAFDHCLKNGVITFWFLSCPNAFRLAPPLNITEADLIKGIEVIREAILAV